jgi:hypothetical protein
MAANQPSLTTSIVTLPDGSKALNALIPLPEKGSISSLCAHEAGLHGIGKMLMDKALESLDADGEPLRHGRVVITSKGRQNQTYHTVFGDCDVSRHTYQSSKGGMVFVPLEERGRILALSTPRLAKTLAARYTDLTAAEVSADMAEHHGLNISKDTVERIAKAVADVALAKEDFWTYSCPVEPAVVHHIALGFDGTTVPLRNEDAKWKMAMVGTITLYDKDGERLDTAYIGAAPEDGKAAFYERLAGEVASFKARYPGVLWIGVTDGAAEYRTFLEKHCDKLLLDFYHATEYLAAVSDVMAGAGQKPAEWLKQACSNLKNQKTGPARLLRAMTARAGKRGLDPAQTKALAAAITYFTNNMDRMDYAAAVLERYPIGSGITEAACKTLVKQRLCRSGMRWLAGTVDQVLVLRCLRKSASRWRQFWSRIERYGY